MGKLYNLKKCKLCGLEKPLDQFHKIRDGSQLTSRCKKCHGLSKRTCVICMSSFVGLRSKILCSPECRLKYRPQTFKNCENCGKRFGPVARLSARYCEYACKAAAQATGRTVSWQATEEAHAAHLAVRRAVRRGELIRPTCCAHCGQDARTEGAHSDYSKPLEVKWLCRRCHVVWDRASPKGGAVRSEYRPPSRVSRKGTKMNEEQKAALKAAWIIRKQRKAQGLSR